MRCSSLTGVLSTTAAARTTIKNICRLKGQEENTLQGIGIVVGLKGTGDGGNFLPTLRSLEKIMKVMGDPTGLKEIKDAKNVALVTVTATIPAAGARQGDKIDCVVSSIGSCKSLAGGRLFLTAMIGPDPEESPGLCLVRRADHHRRFGNAQLPAASSKAAVWKRNS